MKVLQVFDPELGEEEVVALQLQTEFPQAYWFTLNVTFYVMKDELFAAWMRPKIEKLRRTFEGEPHEWTYVNLNDFFQMQLCDKTRK